ncbi:MAG: cysteine--tRNA ligase [Myxococcota bacterium]|nr:cysteine--tRNA ligase [Myxococcota bacterium]
MAVRIYNTLTRQKEEFVPLVPGKVGMYVCGPTVYDMAHVGHARSCVAFDLVVRHLRRRFDVNYVRNYTDVDDKIIKRANELGQESTEVSERYIREFKTDMASLGNAEPDHEPKVTQHIADIITLIEKVIANGKGYAVEGDVYFAVDSFDGYGKLSGRKLDDMEAGARVEVDTRKRNPMDFALWKSAKPGEPWWDSPWGKGRPGWHIECSAMSEQYLGKTLDIHGGGKDLIFPHHENEIAQSEAAHSCCYVTTWMHNGFVNIDNEKMSKSLGNFFTVREVLEKFDGQTIRFYLSSTHYRSPINFSDTALKEADGRLKYLYETLARLKKTLEESAEREVEDGPFRDEGVAGIVARYEEAMDDDFNTARALADLSEVFKLINEVLDKPGDPATDLRTLRAVDVALKDVGGSLGLFVEDPDVVLERMAKRRHTELTVDPALIEKLIVERAEARESKNYQRSDEIRDQLKDMGVVLKDAGGQTTWEMA